MSEKFIVEGWKLFKGELFSSKQTTLKSLIRLLLLLYSSQRKTTATQTNGIGNICGN